MKNIKFRAWHNQIKEMFLDFPNMNVFFWIEQDHQDMEIMQFTGLCDKNGKEIYEGDILKDYDNEQIAVVSFEDGSFIATYENISTTIFEWSGEEIIGNIYENPELLA